MSMECWWNDADMGQPMYSESVLVPHYPPKIPHELALELNPGLRTEKPRRIMFTDNDALLSDVLHRLTGNCEF